MTAQQQPPPLPVEPPWLTIARCEVGVKERAGNADHPRIIEYLRTVIRDGDLHDEIPWCSAYVNWCMVQAGIEGTGLANARSWLRWGVALHTPRPGCVVVLRRGLPNDRVHGHVGFFVRRAGNQLWLLGGNQGNEVCVAPRQAGHLLGLRWPLPPRMVLRQ